MSWTDDFNNCMSSSGMPLPGQVFDAAKDTLELVEQLRNAWEAAGGTDEMTMATLVAAAEAAAIDATVLAALAAAFADAAAITVAAYLGACLGCAISATLSAAWDDLFATVSDSWVQGQLTAEANSQGIPGDILA